MKEKITASNKKKRGQPRTRMRREPPERNGPIRSRSIFNQATGSGQNSAAGGPYSGSERVDRAVNTAYRVCEEHLRNGWEAAARHRENFATKEAPRPSYQKSDPYDGRRGRGEQMWGIMYHTMYDMMNLWMEMLAPFLSVGAPWPTQQRPDPRNDAWAWAWAGAARPQESHNAGSSYSDRAEPRQAGPSGRPLYVVLQLSSKLPVRALVEVERRAVNQVFPLQAIPGFDGSGQVAVDASGRVELQLEVPDGQLPGIYSQDLWDSQHHTKVGAVKLVIDPAHIAP